MAWENLFADGKVERIQHVSRRIFLNAQQRLLGVISEKTRENDKAHYLGWSFHSKGHFKCYIVRMT